MNGIELVFDMSSEGTSTTNDHFYLDNSVCTASGIYKTFVASDSSIYERMKHPPAAIRVRYCDELVSYLSCSGCCIVEVTADVDTERKKLLPVG